MIEKEVNEIRVFLAADTLLISWRAAAADGAADLRLRERGRMWGEQRPPSSSVMLSVLPKCLDKKWSSSMVGWEGSWFSLS